MSLSYAVCPSITLVLYRRAPCHPVCILSQAALALVNLLAGGINAAQLHSLTTSERVHRIKGNVEPRGGVVNGEDVDGATLVIELPARATLGSLAGHLKDREVGWTYRGAVPASNSLNAADVGELLDLLLGLPAVPSDEAVGAVGAADRRQGAGAVIVASVVGNSGSRRGGDGSEDGEEVGDLHFCDGMWMWMLM